MKKYIKTILLVAIFSSIFSCGERKSNRQIFEENLNSYIESSIPAFIQKGVDSTSARKICKCVMEKMYKLDSTFFKKNIDNIDEIIDSNPSEFEDCIKWYKDLNSSQEQ